MKVLGVPAYKHLGRFGRFSSPAFEIRQYQLIIKLMTGAEKAHTPERRESTYLLYLQENGFSSLTYFELSIFFGGHGTEKDADDALEYAKGFDTLIPEGLGWNADVEEGIQAVAAGTLSVEDSRISARRFPGYISRLLTGLPGKHVALADLPEEKSATAQEATKNWIALPGDVVRRQWSRPAARELLVAREKNLAEAIIERETHIVENLGPAVVRAHAGDPEREARTSLRALILLGADHADIARAMKKEHPALSVAFQDDPLVQQRRVHQRTLQEILVQGHPVSEEAADNALFERLLHLPMSEFLLAVLKRDVGAPFVSELVNKMNDAEREAYHAVFLGGELRDIIGHICVLLKDKAVSACDFDHVIDAVVKQTKRKKNRRK